MTTGLALLAGLLIVGGGCAVLVGALPRVPQLADALAGLAVDDGTADEAADLGSTGSRTDRLGAWCYRVSPLRLTDRQRQSLQIRGTSIAEFYADKAVLALVGLISPTIVVGSISLASGLLPVGVSVLVGLLGAVVGWFVPDLQLRGGSRQLRQDANQALLTYFDLVTLERLANASATQALHNAALISDAPLFLRIRRSLQRAQLEQQSPYLELRRLADQLGLPELADLVDIMQLDESGASLAGTLRARVRELRDAHLAADRERANAVSESMTVFMTFPALIFGLFFIVPPMLRIIGQ